MTPKLCRIWACELCIIKKDTQIDLNRSRTRLVIDLQHKSVGRHTCNSLFSTKSAAYYKDILLPNVEYLYTTIKDAVQSITYLPIKPKSMVNIKHTLGFCD